MQGAALVAVRSLIIEYIFQIFLGVDGRPQGPRPASGCYSQRIRTNKLRASESYNSTLAGIA